MFVKQESNPYLQISSDSDTTCLWYVQPHYSAGLSILGAVRTALCTSYNLL